MYLKESNRKLLRESLYMLAFILGVGYLIVAAIASFVMLDLSFILMSNWDTVGRVLYVGIVFFPVCLVINYTLTKWK